MKSIAEILKLSPVIPVLTIESADTAVPLARALLAGGLRVLEVTLRTEAALAAISAIARAVPEAVVGAGTVLNADDYKRACDNGARFIVSPGLTDTIRDTAESIPYRCCRVSRPQARSCEGSTPVFRISNSFRRKARAVLRP